MVATAVPVAVALHLVIVFLIYRDRKKPVAKIDSPVTNVVLTVFSGAFLALTVLSGDRWDYTVFLAQWIDVVEGRDPWNFVHSFNPNAYGPLFNLLAPSVFLNLLVNKLLFAFSYLIYVIWLIKDFGPRRGLETFSWSWVSLLLLNPFPWWEIAYLGYFDILVGLACVAAVHWRLNNRDWLSGIFVGVGILLKFVPIVILPFLTFNGERVHFRLIMYCAGVVLLGFAASLLVWGPSTFVPLTFALTRDATLSIYNLLDSTHSPLRLFLDSPNSEWLAKPSLFLVSVGVYAWCVVHRTGAALSAAITVLVILLFYWVGWSHYQMVVLVLISYWAVSEWKRFNEHLILNALVVSYFSLLTVADLARQTNMVEHVFYSNMGVLLLRFLAGSVLAVALLIMSVYERNVSDTQPYPRMKLSKHDTSRLSVEYSELSSQGEENVTASPKKCLPN
jgi:hypothetical protein